jgi:thioredoxin reductase (NADPH)
MAMEEDLEGELVIIGGGPAGMTAAIYGARYGLKTVLLESRVLGGAQATSPGIENYPGFSFIMGIELANRMKEQVKKCGATIREITEVKSIRTVDNGSFVLETRRGDYKANAIILATGGEYRKLHVPGEDQYTGQGVSYCATCDGPLFREKTIAVVGGGNTAVTEALYLKDLATKVYLIHRRDELSAEQAVQDMLFESEIEIMWSHVVKEFKGEDLLTEIVLENLRNGETTNLVVDGAFVALGSEPQNKLAIELGVEMNERGEIIADAHQGTNLLGVFAAGDVVENLKQIAVAVGQGAIAADSAFSFVRGVKLGPR